MKKTYSDPQVEIITFCTPDVITESPVDVELPNVGEP